MTRKSPSRYEELTYLTSTYLRLATRTCFSEVEGSLIPQMLHVWYIYQPLPRFTRTKSPSFVGKYTSTMVRIYGFSKDSATIHSVPRGEAGQLQMRSWRCVPPTAAMSQNPGIPKIGTIGFNTRMIFEWVLKWLAPFF